MKILKTLLIVIVVIIAIPLIIAIFVSKDYAVEREITINKPETEVFNYVKHLKNQDYYSVWSMADPNMKTEFTGTDGTPGFIYAWDGNKDVGKGEIEIQSITENERMDMELRFIEPWEGTAYGYMATEPAGDNSTKVIWGMKGTSAYPMNFMNLFTDSMIGGNIEKSLANLKTNLEK